MHWADINAALYKKGSSPNQITLELGIKSTSFVARVIRGETTSYNVASLISAKTGIPLSKLWPDGRYNRPPKAAALHAVSSRRAAA